MPTPTLETIWAHDDVRVTLDRSAKLVTFMRLSPSLPALPELRARLLDMLAHMEKLPRAELGLIVDTRQAIGRSDDDFEALMAEVRPRMVAGFRKVAVLVRTAVGRLQIQRLSRADGTADNLCITSDEAEARAFVGAV